MSGEPKKVKKPYIAMLLSFIVPGLGQMYNGQFYKSFAILGILMVLNFLASEPLMIIMETGAENIDKIDRNVLVLVAGYFVAAIFLTVVAIYDAKLDAEKINDNIDEEDDKDV